MSRHLAGLANYYSFVYPISAYWEIERHVQGLPEKSPGYGTWRGWGYSGDRKR